MKFAAAARQENISVGVKDVFEKPVLQELASFLHFEAQTDIEGVESFALIHESKRE